MALVKNPLGGIAASGSVGGTTFARNRAGQYARAWAKPVNPATVRQTQVRSQFGISSLGWGGLTAVQIAAWDAYGQLLVRLNKLGEEYTPKGRQVYMEIAQNLQQVGVTPLTLPTDVTDNPSMVSIGAIVSTETGGTIDAFTIADIAFDLNSAAEGIVLIEATPPHDPKLTNVNNLYRQVQFEVGPTPVASSDIEAAYIAVFGSAGLAGQQIDLRFRVVDNASGLGSSWLKATATLS